MPQLIHWSASLIVAAVIVLPLLHVSAGAQDAPKPDVNPRAAVLADFQRRIDEYVKLHEKAAKGPAQMKETPDPADIRQAQAALAERLRAARADARQGDIFTPEIAAEFRRLMYPGLKGEEGRDAKAIIREDAPQKRVPLRVNAAYPEGEPRPTVPANLLVNLPRLPDDLEYRIVNRNLILLDVDANLVVDFIPNAIR